MSAPKITKKVAEQTIELDELFNVDFSDKKDLKSYIGQVLIDRIRSKVESGVGIKFSDDGKGRPFDLRSVPYSKNYIDSDKFKAFGKNKNNVNMTLTGDMLGLIDIIDLSDNNITIGWNDEEQILKVYNHTVGDTVPARPFFGLSKSELKEIANDLKKEIKDDFK